MLKARKQTFEYEDGENLISINLEMSLTNFSRTDLSVSDYRPEYSVKVNRFDPQSVTGRSTPFTFHFTGSINEGEVVRARLWWNNKSRYNEPRFFNARGQLRNSLQDIRKKAKGDLSTPVEALQSLVSSASCYEESRSFDELSSFVNFAENFGYEDLRSAIDPFRGCCKAYGQLFELLGGELRIGGLYDQIRDWEEEENANGQASDVSTI